MGRPAPHRAGVALLTMNFTKAETQITIETQTTIAMIPITIVMEEVPAAIATKDIIAGVQHRAATVVAVVVTMDTIRTCYWFWARPTLVSDFLALVPTRLSFSSTCYWAAETGGLSPAVDMAGDTA